MKFTLAEWPYKRMLVSELHKIMVNKVSFVGFRGGRDQSPPCFWEPFYVARLYFIVVISVC